jgi:hypothetical protein
MQYYSFSAHTTDYKAWHPFFPGKSIDNFHQGEESSEAWERYNIGKRNFDQPLMKYEYYRDGGAISERRETNRPRPGNLRVNVG